jgi:hypothetical protein
VFLIPLLATPSVASTYAQLPTLEDLDRLSRAVITGEIVAASTEQAPWGLVTTYEIAVSQVLNGTAGKTLRVQLPGGRKDGLVQRYAGVPDWLVGDDVLVFVPRTGVLPLTGVFTVVEGEVRDPLARFPEPVQVSQVADLLGHRALGR